MKISALLFVLFSLSAHAHFQIGTYKGVTPEGADCSVKFESVSFTTSFKHPLAERVVVSAMEKSFTLSHPVKVSEDAVVYNEESLETTIPLQGGAEFFRVIMNEAPETFVHMIHDWKKNKLSKVTCEKLSFQVQ